MVSAYHLIFTAYGWWLPNDPRGSSSHEIRSDLVAELGELHHGRKSVQPNGSTIRSFYQEARKVLKHELRTFNTTERETIACGFARLIHKRNYTCYACAIMPDHVHILIRKHRDKAEQMITEIQSASRAFLIEQNLYPSSYPVWGGSPGPGWKVYLNTARDIERTIQYIKRNPAPYGMPDQYHPFVAVYDGWSLSNATRKL